ncbi:unnamed protein product [Hymenolepis diminuta]|uniref:Integrase catalytic domain-containing protein n=1 Tax=Hymenolepis diminuta TaxID=6216 RepID=A0A564Z1C9_HYMDI|nr:unnamed protein product [Hymenolepis diminuta]
MNSHFKWPEAISMPLTYAAATISFEEYCRQGTIDHIRTLLYHPQSNGETERFVETFERGLLEENEEGTKEKVIRKFSLTYRTTPHPIVGGKSHAELLMRGTVRTFNYTMIPKMKNKRKKRRRRRTSEPAKRHERGLFIVDGLVFGRDFRIGNFWTVGNVVKRRGKCSMKSE